MPLLALLVPLAASAGEAVTVPSPEPYVLLQAWLTAYDMDEDPQADPAGYGDPEDDIGVKIRRARLGFEGENARLAYGVVVGISSPYDAVMAARSPDSGSTIKLVDAYGGFAPIDALWVKVGQQRVPVSRETLMESGELVFQEGSVATEWLTPGRDAGLLLDGKLGPGRLRVGAFNGNGGVGGDDNTGKLLSGRLEATFGPGNSYETYGEVEGFTIGIGADGFLDDDVATQTLGAGADLMLRVAGLAVSAEGRMNRLSPTNTDVATPEVYAPVSRMGISAQAGYSVGALEPVVRFSTFDDDTEADDNGDVAQAQLGVVWHGLDDAVRAGAGYALRLEMGGTSISNDTARLWFQLRL